MRRNSHGERMPKAWDANVRCGSLAAAVAPFGDVRFAPECVAKLFLIPARRTIFSD
jgi:hypothetical protein